MKMTKEQLQKELQIAKNMASDGMSYYVCGYNKRLRIHNDKVDLCIRMKPGEWIQVPIIKEEDAGVIRSGLRAYNSTWFTVGTTLYLYYNPADTPWATQEDLNQEFRVYNLHWLRDPVPANQAQLDVLIENLRGAFLQERYTSLYSAVWDSFNLRGENLTYDLDEKDRILGEYGLHMRRDRDFNEFMTSYVDYDFDGSYEYDDGAYWLWPVQLEVEYWESELSYMGNAEGVKQDEQHNPQAKAEELMIESAQPDVKTNVQVEKKAKKGFSKTDKIIAFCIIGFFLALVIWAVWSKSQKESRQERTYQTESIIESDNIVESGEEENIAEQITKQLDQLTEAINALPEPNENNVSRCGDKVKVLQWEVIDIPEDDPNAERLKKSQRRAVETFVNAKNRYIKKLEKYDEYAGVYYDEVEGYLLDDE